MRLSPVGVVTWSPSSTHDWSVPTAEEFILAVGRVWKREFGVCSTSCSEQARQALDELGAVENPQATPNIPLRQVRGTENP